MVKIALIVLAAAIAAVSILFAGLAMVEKNDVGKLDPLSLYPIITERWPNNDSIVTEKDASESLGYDVDFPESLTGYSVALTTIESHNDDNQLYLFYSKDLISDTMRLNDFFSQNGVFIIYQKDLDSDSWISHRLDLLKNQEYTAYQISINGDGGIAIMGRDRNLNNHTIHDPSQVEFVRDGVRITLQSYLSETDLITIAESMT